MLEDDHNRHFATFLELNETGEADRDDNTRPIAAPDAEPASDFATWASEATLKVEKEIEHECDSYVQGLKLLADKHGNVYICSVACDRVVPQWTQLGCIGGGKYFFEEEMQDGVGIEWRMTSDDDYVEFESPHVDSAGKPTSISRIVYAHIRLHTPECICAGNSYVQSRTRARVQTSDKA